MRGRILSAAVATAALAGAAPAGASEGSQARAVAQTVRPFAAGLPQLDAIVANAISDAGDQTVARCAGAADAIATQPAARRAGLVRGLTLLQLGLDTLPATIQVVTPVLLFTQDELQDLPLTSPTLKTARAARRNAIKRLVAIAGRRESICPVLEPWAAAGFPTAAGAPTYAAIRATNRRAAANLEQSDAAFDGTRDPRRAAGGAALARAGASRRVQQALTLAFSLPATSGAVNADPFARRLRKAARR